MDYRLHYDRLMIRAKGRILEGYVERHHIVPKCLGGLNGRDNIVQLTPEEHFVAHQLLAKMHPESRGLAYALIAMTMNRPRSHSRSPNKLFGWCRRRCSYTMRKSMTLEKREAVRQQRLGSKHSEATKEKMRKPRPGYKRDGLKELRWINDGVKNKRIAGDLPDGWSLGRIKWAKKRTH